jgi:hypothetical protein
MAEFWQFAVSVFWAHFTLSGGCVLTVLVGLFPVVATGTSKQGRKGI